MTDLQRYCEECGMMMAMTVDKSETDTYHDEDTYAVRCAHCGTPHGHLTFWPSTPAR